MCAEWAPKVRVIKYPLTWGGGSGNVFFLPTVPWRRKWQPIPVFLQENSTDRGAWRATVHGVEQSQTRLSG